MKLRAEMVEGCGRSKERATKDLPVHLKLKIGLSSTALNKIRRRMVSSGFLVG
jgi:hypothetical protein